MSDLESAFRSGSFFVFFRRLRFLVRADFWRFLGVEAGTVFFIFLFFPYKGTKTVEKIFSKKVLHLFFRVLYLRQIKKTRQQKIFFKKVLHLIFIYGKLKTNQGIKEANKMDNFSMIVIILSSVFVGYMIGRPDKFF